MNANTSNEAKLKNQVAAGASNERQLVEANVGYAWIRQSVINSKNRKQKNMQTSLINESSQSVAQITVPVAENIIGLKKKTETVAEGVHEGHFIACEMKEDAKNEIPFNAMSVPIELNAKSSAGGQCPSVTQMNVQPPTTPPCTMPDPDSCEFGRNGNKSPAADMFTHSSEFPNHKLFEIKSCSAHLMAVRHNNVGTFVPLPHHAGAPTYGPDRWLTVTGPGAHSSLQNFTIHHAALVESPTLNRTNLPAHFQLDAIQDINGFAKALLNPNDEFAHIIRNRLAELGEWSGSSSLPEALASRIVAELNRMVRMPDLVKRVPFVDPEAGSLASVLSELADPSLKDKALLVKSLIEDRYPSQLSRHRRLRSAQGRSSGIWLIVNYATSLFGYSTPFPVLIVCRPNTCSRELASAITRGEVTDIRIGGDILGAVFPVPQAIRPTNTPGAFTSGEEVVALGFRADSGFTPPTTRDEFNALSQRLHDEKPVQVG